MFAVSSNMVSYSQAYTRVGRNSTARLDYEFNYLSVSIIAIINIFDSPLDIALSKNDFSYAPSSNKKTKM